MPGLSADAGCRVMIVEDEALIAADLGKRLQALGYEVCGETDTGEAALELAPRYAPDIALMDILLAGELNGLETAASLWERFNVPSVVSSAHVDEKLLKQAQEAGVFGCVVKPCEDRELRTALEMGLHQARESRRRRQEEQELRLRNEELERRVSERTAALTDANWRLSLHAAVLERLNRSGREREIIRDLLALVRERTGFEAVAIRLQEGEDFPYYLVSGFPTEFVIAERWLCARHPDGSVVRDGKGNPFLECMCGNVIVGRTDPRQPFFTPGGSFWTNSTTLLLASTSERERLTRTRNRCNLEGYESLALIPLKSGSETVGLLQFVDCRTGCFTEDRIRFFEEIGAGIGVALARRSGRRPDVRADAAGEGAGSDRAVLLEALGDAMRATETHRLGEAHYRSLFLSSPTPQLEVDCSPLMERAVAQREWEAEATAAYFDDHPRVRAALMGRIRLLQANRAALELFGVRQPDNLLDSLSDICLDESWRMCSQLLAAIVTGRRVFVAETAFRRFGGERVHVLFQFQDASPDAAGSLARAMISLSDITDRKRAELELRAALEEKDVLFREVHHRVKNNLQIIISLLNMQARTVRNKLALGALEDSRNRIRAMAMIHEILYSSGFRADVTLADYLRRLGESLFQAFDAAVRGVRLRVDLTGVHLRLDAAVSCGLILNELLTNALKYAFPGGGPGEISISGGADEDGAIRMVFRDDGVGMPPDFDWRAAGGMGLSMVVTLVENQLKGSIERLPGPGTGFIMLLPVRTTSGRPGKRLG